MTEVRYSEQIDQIATALAAAQGEFPTIEKGKTAKVKGKTQAGNSYEYEYKYADIADVLSGILPVLSKHHLAPLQPTVVEAGSMFIRTRLVHSSGQWIESDYPVCSIQGDHQRMGAALTYARRYALCSLIGVAAEEDHDGDIGEVGAASKQARQATARERPAPAVVQAAERKPLPPEIGQPAEGPSKGDYVRECFEIIDGATDAGKLKEWWNGEKNARTRYRLTQEDVDELKEPLTAKIEELAGAVVAADALADAMGD